MQGVKCDIDKNFIYFLYNEKKMSVRDIEKNYGISKSVMGRAIKKYGVSRNRRDAELAELNKGWKGKNASASAGNHRARSWFGAGSCEICGKRNAEIHHKDRNTMNNVRENLKYLCRRHHFDEHMEMRRSGI